jgi:hypothetical protein
MANGGLILESQTRSSHDYTTNPIANFGFNLGNLIRRTQAAVPVSQPATA